MPKGQQHHQGDLEQAQELNRQLYLRAKRVETVLSGSEVAESKEARAEETLNTPGRRLSESRMRENLMSGSRRQGMETRTW